jgi:hypothetical protein
VDERNEFFHRQQDGRTYSGSELRAVHGWAIWDGRHLAPLRDLFAKEREQFGFHPGKRGIEPLFEIEFADSSLDSGWVAEGAQEIIRCQPGKPLAIHGLALTEDKLAGKQGEDGIADPGSFTFLAEFFGFSAHAGEHAHQWTGWASLSMRSREIRSRSRVSDSASQ